MNLTPDFPNSAYLENGVKRQIFWISSNQDPLYACLHLPRDAAYQAHAVVICNPFGHEYAHAHRTLKTLADFLAVKGIPTLRFDYCGSGDSAGNMLQENLFEHALQDIHSVICFLKQALNIHTITLVGLRLGATLAACYAEKFPVNNLVLWAPCSRGKAYVRELKALEKLASFDSDTDKDFIESAGFIMSVDFAHQLSQVNLASLQMQCKRMLLVKRDDMDDTEKLESQLKVNHELCYSSIEMQGYLSMMAEPHENEVPITTLVNLAEWIAQEQPISMQDKPRLDLNVQIAFEGYYERMIQVGDQQLQGIVSIPTQYLESNVKKRCVILANSGSVHHVGPNRFYTQFARRLAQQGTMVIRFDMRNLGDSSFYGCIDENKPYPAASSDDIVRVVQYAKQELNAEHITIAGLCSGGHNVFHTALESHDVSDIDEVIMINPLAFYRRPSRVVDDSRNQAFARDVSQYRKSVFSAKKWKKFITGKVSLGYVFKFLAKGFSGIIKLIAIRLLKLFGLRTVTQLGQDLLRFKTMSIPLTFIIADQDPGKALLEQHGRDTVKQLIRSQVISIYEVPRADHTFTTQASRDRFFQCFKDYYFRDKV